MSEMELVFDSARLDEHIKVDDDRELVVSAVIASEIVHKYGDGWAYKPAAAIEQMVKYAKRCPVPVHLMKHPPMGVTMNGDNISGYVDNFEYVKNLLDPKTQRPMRRGARADIHWYKQFTDEAILEQIRNRILTDVSIGFFFKRVDTPGEWNGQSYDYIQDPILLNHVAAPVPIGRCPAPYCGIGGDAVPVQLQVGRENPYLLAGDPWETTEEYHRSGHRSPGQFHSESLRTITIGEGVKAIVGCPKSATYSGGRCQNGMEVQSYLFPVGKFTLSEAKAWYSAHKGDTLLMEYNIVNSTVEGYTLVAGDPFAGFKDFEDCVKKVSARKDPPSDPEAYCAEIQRQAEGEGDKSPCPLCDKIEELGSKRFAALMVRTLGDVALKVLGDGSHPLPAVQDKSTSEGEGANLPSTPTDGGRKILPVQQKSAAEPFTNVDLIVETQKVMGLYTKLRKKTK